jgi:hypothetical protein
VEFVRIRRTPAPQVHAHTSEPTTGARVSLWPSEITGRGKQTLGSFTPCAICGQGTWSSYGGTPFCRRHAIAEASRRKATDDPR